MQDHDLLHLIIAVTLLLTVFSFFLVLFVVRHNNQQRKAEMEKQMLLFALEKKDLKISADERELILEELSHEVYENVGEIAMLIRMYLHYIEGKCAVIDNEELSGYVKNVVKLTDGIIKDIRDIESTLNGKWITSLGLFHAIEYDCHLINASEKVLCTLKNEGFCAQWLSRKMEQIIYRIAQEATNNAMKHSSARNISIDLVFRKDFFKMTILDDGVGFNPSEVDERLTSGITGIKKRAKLLDADLSIKSQAGHGCRLELLVKPY